VAHGPENDGNILMESVSFEDMRRAMVDSQLRTNGVTEAWILGAMGSLPREDHVPASHRATSYMDRAIALDDGSVLNPPLSTALLLQAAEVKTTDKTLLIGNPGGYVAELLKGHVTHLTCAAPADWASAKDNAPYNLIVIDGAIEELPDAFLGLASEGARIVSGIAEGPVTRLANGVVHAGKVALKPFIDSEIAPLAAFARKAEFVF
jgi:protein-L-isoaspartate(D-aspartate) O-methyltransferase